MAKPYDAAMRQLFEHEPADSLEFLGIPAPDPALVRLIDSNLSAVASEADKLVRRDGPDPLIVHFEFLSGRDLDAPSRLHWYNSVATRKHEVPVWSVAVLLRPAADGPDLTGVYEREVPGLGRNLWFRYDVVRVWELPPDRLLGAGLTVLPLAPITNVPPDQLPRVLTRVVERLRVEADPKLQESLWTVTEILLGLNHPREHVKELLAMLISRLLIYPAIKESSVYQDILAEGRAEGEARGELEEARKVLLRLGRKKLGEPAEPVQALILGMGDLDRLNTLLDRILDVATWDELLAGSGS